MATTKAKRGTKAGTSKAATRKSTRKATETAAKTEDGPSKRELQRAQNAEIREQVVEMRDEQDSSWSDIAEELSITPGKAQFLYMQAEVARKPKLKIKHTDEDELVEGIREAREANDAHSSWGWIAARTGVSEGKVKALAEEAGIPVTGTNVAVARAEANGSAKKGDGKTATQAGRAKTSGKSTAKTAAAKKRAASRKRPS
jgi:hypothetical protein